MKLQKILKMWLKSLLIGLLWFPLSAMAGHLISITATTPFSSSVAASSTATAVYTVTNLSSIPLTGIEDESILPAEMNILPSSTCYNVNSSNPLAGGGSCTWRIQLNAPAVAGQISGAVLREHPLPSLDGVIYEIPSIQITPAASSYTVTSSAGSNGSISPSGAQTVTSGDSITFTATAASGYSINQWSVDASVVQSGGSTYTLSNVTANHTVSVSFTVTPGWGWISGSGSINRIGNYGTKGVAASTNVPGSRNNAISWIDSSNNLWLFGGFGCDKNTICSFSNLNDLWKFDGTNWTWVSGSDERNQAGNYGTKGVAASTNVPGARSSSISWRDSHGNLWLFGGTTSSRTTAYTNDLWKFDGTNWTWVSGANTFNQAGVYGTKGIASSSNVPGARSGAVSWIDNDGNLWLFGGIGFDQAGTLSRMNDLWKFDGTNWTWVSGSDTVEQAGVYGTKGVASSSNIPGARNAAVSWKDSDGNLWLFGGTGYDSAGTLSNLNDLWKFDGTNWTWVSGSDTVNQAGVYGTKGTAASTNVPGARNTAISWIDSSNNLWLFGGSGYDSAGNSGSLNDLWKFDGSNWTWVSGSNTINQSGTYGTKGVPASSNIPGARFAGVSWIDSSNNLWLFGGFGYGGSAATSGRLNDLWKYYIGT